MLKFIIKNKNMLRIVMKIITNLFTILLISNLSLHATGTCSDKPTTENVTSTEIMQPAGASDIDDLKGTNCDNEALFSFKIKSLPLASEGILSLANGTPVTTGQTLTEAEAKGLKFDPADGFTGNATFTYVAIDDRTGEGTTATVTIPVSGGACTEAPTSDDKANATLVNTLGAVDIIDLSGKACGGVVVEKFKIKSLPNANAGVLYMADGVTAVTVGQVLTQAEANGLKFDPADGFVGDATFTYAAIDCTNREDSSPATVTIPVSGGACTEAPTSDDKANSKLLNTLGAVNILNLDGQNCAGKDVEKFKIKSLPNANAGVLYMADGVSPVTVGQILTRVEANGLKFDPADGFVGDATFTYAAIDEQDREDASPAIVRLPIIGGNGGGHPGGGSCTEAPNTEDKANSKLLNTLGAVNILNLDGQNCAGKDVEKFKIKSLPDANEGVLYMADGVSPVTVDQILTRAQANGLKFDPADGFVGDATFTYVAIDNQDREDTTPATVTLPVTGANCGGVCTEPITEDKRNDNLLNTLPAVNILNLAGQDCAGADVEHFKIVTLPNANAGVLYMADGVTPVTVGQILTREEANGLKFDPADGFVGDATFTYAAIDEQDREDATPATVTLPITGGNGGVCHEAPTTDDIHNPNLTHNLPAVNILNLNGQDCAGKDVENFRIITLPNANAGILYMADGVTPVKIGQLLTREEANGLRFDPADNFVGTANFTYVAIDANGRADETPATVTLPIINVTNGGNGNGCQVGDENCTCDTYESSVPASTPFGLMIMALLTLFIVRKSFKKEL